MLTILAAIIPVLTGMVVAVWALVEYNQRAFEARVWARLRERENASLAEIEAKATDYAEWDRLRQHPMALRQRLMELNGLDPSLGTYKQTLSALEPSYPPASEQWRQWLLLGSSALSLFLLALSASL